MIVNIHLKYKYNKMVNIFSVIILIFLFSFISSNIISIPFKILDKNSINSMTNISDPYTVIRNEMDQFLYTEISIGEPAQKMIAIITFYSEDLEMHHYTTKNLFSNTLYERDKSKTYKKLDIKESNNNTLPLKQYLQEQIKLYNDINLKNMITISDLNFSLFETKSDTDESSLCFNIGFKLPEKVDEGQNINTNIIPQLKRKNLISSYNFNFHFNQINIDGVLYDGYIIIGNEPHQYLKNSYNELQLYKTKVYKRDSVLSWIIYFNKIFFTFDGKEYIMDAGIEYFNEAALTPNRGIIEGTVTYERNIKKYFFTELIKEKKCNRIYKDYYIYYYCYKDRISLDDLKRFPSLYFSSVELDFVFELDYKDLFLEKGEYIYFLIITYDYPSEIQEYFDEYVSKWDLGMTFLKKYFFTFDYDNKYIGFYNTNISIPNSSPMIISKNNNKESKSYLVFVFVVVFIVVIFIAFLLARKYFGRNGKISAIELESDNNYNNNNLNSKYSKYYNVEMGQKNFLIEE